MLSVQNAEVFNFMNAVRGARNPMNSWGRMDSAVDEHGRFVFGSNDLTLAKKLVRAGSDHRKFLRQIMVSVDITAPMYWWKEFDTYKIGTVANSTSTMHKIHQKNFSEEDFSCDQMDDGTKEMLRAVIGILEQERLKFTEAGDKQHWWNIIQLLPSSYNQMRTCTMNYENLIGIYRARRNHKLDEWRVFCNFIASLPYAEELIILE